MHDAIKAGDVPAELAVGSPSSTVWWYTLLQCMGLGESAALDDRQHLRVSTQIRGICITTVLNPKHCHGFGIMLVSRVEHVEVSSSDT
jgi:hypothetical protein